jgi:hypothetical protein
MEWWNPYTINKGQNLPNPVDNIIIYFATNLGANSFKMDLGTGYPN